MLAQVLLACLCLAIVRSQQVGNLQQEQHPQVTVQQCSSNGCNSMQRPIVLDANWRWVHKVGTSTNCYTGDEWDTSMCPDPVTCAQNCALEGADYQGTYGIQAGGNTVNLKFVTVGQYSTNIGSRVYLMQDDNNYQMLQLLNREFTFDVDVSNLPCGLNGALYLVEMSQDGGLSKFPNDKAGAKYGTGYCDAQCPHDLKFINGEANILDWQPSPNDPNSGTGKYGTCCIEMDIWEANSMAEAYTGHVCTVEGQYRCSGSECGDGDNRYGGVCDKDGCDYNSYRMGNESFYGGQKSVDTTQPVTVVTQFHTNDNTDNGRLSYIERIYVQNGKVIYNSNSSYPGLYQYNGLTDNFCAAQKSLFGDKNDFQAKGGLTALGEALSRGVVLVMSLWDDHAADMLWLDSTYPPTKPVSAPGVARGPCPTNTGDPKYVQDHFPNANVKFSNIKWGTIGSTYKN